MTPWELIDEGPGWSGYLRIGTRRYRLPDGSLADWDVFGPKASVAILAVTPDDRVVLARQYRPGPGLVLDEIPGGVVEEGESILDAGARELFEETGYAGHLEFAGSTWLAAASRTRRSVVVARDAYIAGAPQNQVGEYCEVELMPLNDFRRHLRSGQLTDVDLAYLALDHLGLL